MQGGREPSKNTRHVGTGSLTLPKRQTIRTPLPGRGGWGGGAWFGARHKVCCERKEQRDPGTFWAPEKAW